MTSKPVIIRKTAITVTSCDDSWVKIDHYGLVRVKPIVVGFDRKCVGGAKIWKRNSLLRIQFFLKNDFDPTFITRCDRYRCFSDNFRFIGHFRLHGTVFTRPPFNSLTITYKRNKADTLHPLGPNFCTKLFSLKNPVISI